MDISLLSLPSKRSNQNGRISWPNTVAFKQIFSLPDATVFYIAKNPITPKCYSKIIQSCKYFFVKNPIIVATRIHNNGKYICSKNEFDCSSWNCCIIFDITKLSSKIWLTNQRYLSTPHIPKCSAAFASKIFRYEKIELQIFYQTIAFNDFQILASKFHLFCLDGAKIIDTEGNAVMIEKVLESALNVKKLRYEFDHRISTATSSTMKKILELQHLSNIRSVSLWNIPEVITVKHLTQFIKNHKNTKFWLNFYSKNSKEYKNKLNELINTVITSEIRNRVIIYRGQDKKNLQIMYSRYNP